MTCREFWDRMPELDAERLSSEHVRECADCAAQMEQQRALAMSLRRVAIQRNDLAAPARLEERLLEAFRANQAAPLEVPATHLGWPGWAARVSVLAAAMVLGVFLLWRRPPQPVPQVASPETVASAEWESDFVPLPSAGESGSAEDANLIRVEMPRAALVALGVPVADGEAGEPVEAEVMPGMGGAPQAVRVLQ
jgi:hypothetical protein